MNERKNSTRLLILTDEAMRVPGGAGGGISRIQALRRLTADGVKVSADGGGRLLVVEASDAEARRLEKQIPGAKVVDLEEGFEEGLGEVDDQDALFSRALAIRVSPEYREMKANQEPGSTPEEQLLVSGPCVPPER